MNIMTCNTLFYFIRNTCLLNNIISYMTTIILTTRMWSLEFCPYLKKKHYVNKKIRTNYGKIIVLNFFFDKSMNLVR